MLQLASLYLAWTILRVQQQHAAEGSFLFPYLVYYAVHCIYYKAFHTIHTFYINALKYRLIYYCS